MSYAESFRNPQPLSLEPVVACLSDLGEQLRADRLPADALPQMHAFYDRLYRFENHFLHHFAPFICEADEVFEIPTQRPALLDLGCGVGTQSYLLAARGAQIIGVDLDPKRIAAAQAMRPWFESRLEQPLDVEVSAADSFEFMAQLPEQHVAGVFTQFALAYMKPYTKVLELIDRVLAPKGRVVFREFNAGGLYNRVVSRLDRLTDRGYEKACAAFGWKLIKRDFCWLIPKPIIKFAPPGGWMTRLDDRLAKTPIGRSFASSMTLVFEKPA